MAKQKLVIAKNARVPCNNFMNNKDITKKLEKIVVNIGVGRLSSQPNFEEKILPEIIKESAFITGQKASIRKARKSIAGFKLRTGTVVGLKTTLRGKRMADFFSKVTKIVLPRIRDFRGLDPKAIDNGGNMTIGLKEHVVFPEISSELSKTNFGLEITLVPKLQKKIKPVELYKELGVPFSAKVGSSSGGKKLNTQ